MTNVFIITRDVNTAAKIKQCVEQYRTKFMICEVVPNLMDVHETLLNIAYPRLLFCDLELGDYSGLEIFKQLKVNAPIIFFSGSKLNACTAFEANGIDYLLKPLTKNSIEKSLKNYLRLKTLFGTVDTKITKKNHSLTTSLTGYKSSILVYYQDKIIPVNMDKLDFIYYNNAQVNVHTGNTKYETKDSLNNIIMTLNPHDFFRANRQCIIHRKAISSIQQYFGGKLVISTSNPAPEPLIISKANAPEFLKWLEGSANSYNPGRRQ